MANDWRKRIKTDPDVRSGQPTIRGMRITVKDVLELLAVDMTAEQILAEYPFLERSDILAALAYAAERLLTDATRSGAIAGERRERLEICSAQPLADYRVQMTLSNGDVVERDLSDIIWGPVFEPLRADYDNFRAVFVDNGTLTWPGDLDFDPDVLIWNGAAPDDPAARPQPFLRVVNQTSRASDDA